MFMNKQIVSDYRLFFTAFLHAPIGMALVGLDGKWLKTNPALNEIIGYSEEELLAITFQDVTHDDDLKIDNFYVEQLLAGKMDTYQLVKRYYHKNGKIIWALLSVAIVKDRKGVPLYFISQIVDISEMKRMEKRSNDTFTLLTEYSNDIISKHSQTGEFLYVSPSIKKLLGYETEDILEKSLLDFVHHSDSLYVEDVLRRIMSTSKVHTVRYRIKCEDHSYKWMESAFRTIQNKQGDGLEVFAVTKDISEIIDITTKLQQANEISFHDELTGIGNRRAFSTSIEQLCNESTLTDQTLAVILCDIDQFKRYNDTYGHVKGDTCLKQVAHALQEVCEWIGGTVTRYGGEEFIILLPNTNKIQALKAGEGIRHKIEQLQIPHKASTVSPFVTISVGIALTSSQAESSNQLVDRADKALYVAKQRSRNTVVLAASPNKECV